MKIPLIYRLILESIQDEVFENVIEIQKAKQIISTRFRIKKVNLTIIIREMKDLGVISYENHRSLRVPSL